MSCGETSQWRTYSGRVERGPWGGNRVFCGEEREEVLSKPSQAQAGHKCKASPPLCGEWVATETNPPPPWPLMYVSVDLNRHGEDGAPRALSPTPGTLVRGRKKTAGTDIHTLICRQRKNRLDYRTTLLSFYSNSMCMLRTMLSEASWDHGPTFLSGSKLSNYSYSVY